MGMQESKTYVPVISWHYEWIWIACVLVVENCWLDEYHTYFILLYLVWSEFKGENPAAVISHKKKKKKEAKDNPTEVISQNKNKTKQNEKKNREKNLNTVCVQIFTDRLLSTLAWW